MSKRGKIMILDFEISDDKEFFRVKKILDELKESPDYKKDRIILLGSLADKLYKNLEIKTDTNNIKGYRFSGTKIITTNMNEADLIKETIKAVEEQLNVEVAMENLSSLVRFWKESSIAKDVYKPFLSEVVGILNETSVYLNESKNVENIKLIIKSKEEMVEGLKKENAELTKKVEVDKLIYKRYELSIQPFLDNWNIVRDLLKHRTSANPLKEPLLDSFTDIILYLLISRGRASIENAVEELGMTKERIFEVVNTSPYSDILILNDTQTMVGMIDKPSYKFDTEAYLKDVMESKVRPNNKIKVENL